MLSLKLIVVLDVFLYVFLDIIIDIFIDVSLMLSLILPVQRNLTILPMELIPMAMEQLKLEKMPTRRNMHVNIVTKVTPKLITSKLT